MRIAFVHPTMRFREGGLINSFYQSVFLPLWAPILSALTPAEHDRRYISGQPRMIRERDLDGFDLVAMTVIPATASDAYRIGDMCLEMGIKCVMGGYHPSVLPAETKQHCDSVVFGEGETTWAEVLLDAEAGGLKPFYQGSLCEAGAMVVPDFSIYGKRFLLRLPLEIARGCPHRCSFCGIPLQSGYRVRYRELETIRRDLETWERGRVTPLVMPNLMADADKSRRVLELISEYDITWNTACDTTLAHHPDLMALAAESGCLLMNFGFESRSSQELRDLNKAHNTTVDYKGLVSAAHDCGIVVGASFVLGLDGHDRSTWKGVVDFAKDCDLDVSVFFPMTPYPGTDIFHRFDQEGRILTYDWARYNFMEVIFQPLNFSPVELMEMVIDANEESSSWGGVVGKLLSSSRSRVPGGRLAAPVINMAIRANTIKPMRTALRYYRGHPLTYTPQPLYRSMLDIEPSGKRSEDS